MTERIMLTLQAQPPSMGLAYYHMIRKWGGNTLCHRAHNEPLGILAFASESEAQAAIDANEVVAGTNYDIVVIEARLLWTKILETGMRLYIWKSAAEKFLIQESIMANEIYAAVAAQHEPLVIE